MVAFTYHIYIIIITLIERVLGTSLCSARVAYVLRTPGGRPCASTWLAQSMVKEQASGSTQQ